MSSKTIVDARFERIIDETPSALIEDEQADAILWREYYHEYMATPEASEEEARQYADQMME